MSLTAWIITYVAVASFLAWVAFGNALKTLVGGVLASLFIEGVTPMTDRTIRRAAAVMLVLWTAWFLVGIFNPSFRL